MTTTQLEGDTFKWGMLRKV